MCIKALPNRFVKRATFRFRSISGTKSPTLRGSEGLNPPRSSGADPGHLCLIAQERKMTEFALYSLKLCCRSLGLNTCQNAGLRQTAVGNPSARYKSGVLATSYLLELFCDAQYAICKLHISQIGSGYRMQHCRNMPIYHCSGSAETSVITVCYNCLYS